MTDEVNKSFVMEGDITVPYKWTTGKRVGKFLTELKDNKKILGAKCPKCKKVYVPPSFVCGKCFIPPSEFIEVKDEGKVTSFTEVRFPTIWRPCEPPYYLALIRLEGSDTDLIHLINSENKESLKIGAKVKAVWKEEREGDIMDIKYFEIV